MMDCTAILDILNYLRSTTLKILDLDLKDREDRVDCQLVTAVIGADKTTAL